MFDLKEPQISCIKFLNGMKDHLKSQLSSGQQLIGELDWGTIKLANHLS